MSQGKARTDPVADHPERLTVSVSVSETAILRNKAHNPSQQSARHPKIKKSTNCKPPKSSHKNSNFAHPPANACCLLPKMLDHAMLGPWLQMEILLTWSTTCPYEQVHPFCHITDEPTDLRCHCRFTAIADSLPLPIHCHLLLYPCDLPLFRPFCLPYFDLLFVIGPAWVDCRKSLYTFSFVIFTFSTSASSAQILPPRQVTRLGGAHWLFARFHPSMFSIYLLTEPKVRPPANKLCLSYLNFQKWATAFFAFWKSLSP